MSEETQRADQLLRRRQQLGVVACFGLFSLLSIWVLVYRTPTFVNWRDWITVLAAFFFPLLTFLSLLSLWRGWSADHEERIVLRTLGYIVVTPVILLAVIIGGYFAFGWFATIPSWAAVVIVLLVLIYLKK
jgi:peptidoglycan/LPS O-acetylase OafA/YrhL